MIVLDLPWSSSLSQHPRTLADAIELLVAFGGEDFLGRFTQADFIHWASMEDLTDDNAEPVSGDTVDASVSSFEEAIQVLIKRKLWLKEAYPFSVDSDGLALTPSGNEFFGLPYLFLLACSNSGCIPSIPNLPLLFEYLCREALRSLFPAKTEVLMFGPQSEDRKHLFGTSAADALPVLAKKLNTSIVKEEELPEGARDFGVDLMAISAFAEDDRAPYVPFAFAQCTIRTDWWRKRNEAKAKNGIGSLMHLNVEHTNFLMIPFLPRPTLAEWSEGRDRTDDCILCDRFRIMKMLEERSWFQNGPVPEPLSEAFESLRQMLAQSIEAPPTTTATTDLAAPALGPAPD